MSSSDTSKNRKSFYIETHGCQMNVHDSEKISGLLIHRGMTPAATAYDADLYILNTCSVREKAARKVYSRLGEIRARKSRDPNFMVGVVGCVAQQEGEDMVKRSPQVDWVVGTHQYHMIPDLLDEWEAGKTGKRPPRVATEQLDGKELVEIDRVKRDNDFRAHITIMEGCNKRCAFCVVPFTRGKERNRSSRAILEEIQEAVACGYVEIQLLGQTVNHYRDPRRKGYGFSDLLSDITGIDGIRRIRFTSPHPRDFPDDLIAVIAESETICNQVHLPVQSGSSRILRKMRRQHDREWYLELVEKFRRCGRPIALSTDMIVGFPGEQEEDFEATLSLVRQVRFEQMFSFKYSPRPYTEALAWDDDVTEMEKTRRLMILQRLQRDIQLEIHRDRYQDRVFEVLVEGVSRDGQKIFGRTTTNKIINFPGDNRAGEMVEVRVNKIGPNSLSGELISAWETGAVPRRSDGTRV